MKYRCAQCHRLYDRDSNKAWIKSYCSKMDRVTRLIKYKDVKAKPKEPEHIDSETCWCEPELDYTDPDTGVSVYVHRRAQ